jgi:hypothetical protein
VSAPHESTNLERAVAAFVMIGRAHGVTSGPKGLQAANVRKAA